MAAAEYRIEHDSLGEVRVPADRYWGAQTERSRNNFPIGRGRETMPEEIILFGVLTWILVNKFTMTKKDHEEIQRVIRERRENGTVTITDEEKARLEIIAGQKWEDMWIGSPLPADSKAPTV